MALLFISLINQSLSAGEKEYYESNVVFHYPFAALFVGVALDQATGKLFFWNCVVLAVVIAVEIFYRRDNDKT